MGGETWWEDRQEAGGVGSKWMGAGRERKGAIRGEVWRLCPRCCLLVPPGKLVRLERGRIASVCGLGGLDSACLLVAARDIGWRAAKRIRAVAIGQEAENGFGGAGLPSSIANVAILHLRRTRRACRGALCRGQRSRKCSLVSTSLLHTHMTFWVEEGAVRAEIARPGAQAGEQGELAAGQLVMVASEGAAGRFLVDSAQLTTCPGFCPSSM